MLRFWQWLIGDKTQFDLESRVYHAICAALVLCTSLYAPVSFVKLTTQLGWILIVVTTTVGTLFYLSRFKNLHAVSVILFQVCVHVALIVNYYFNSGINGPNLALFLAGFLIAVTIAPARQYFVWLPLNVLLLTGVMGAEFLYPNLIPQTYSNASDRFVDMLFSYYGVAIFAFIAIAFLRKSFILQRKELIAQSVDLIESNQTKNKLLSILGHDLKDPLASLQGYLELLESVELDEDERREMNNQLLIMTKNTSLMLSNILVWASSQDRNFRVSKQTLNVGDTIQHVVEIAEGICSRKQIEFDYDIYPDAGVVGDAQMVELIVRNLLMNAAKFTLPGGKISLTAKNQSQHCIITVKDNGIGIPETMQANVFSFKNESRRGTHAEKGNGIGLRLCKEFTERMGGELGFVSKVGGGSTFTLVLPVAYIGTVKNNDRNKVSNSLFSI